MLFQAIREKYKTDDLQKQKKVNTLVFVNLIVAATALVLGVVMLMTQAYNVFYACMILLLINGGIFFFLSIKKLRTASNLLIFTLYFVMFFAIKFDAYVNVYEYPPGLVLLEDFIHNITDLPY